MGEYDQTIGSFLLYCGSLNPTSITGSNLLTGFTLVGVMTQFFTYWSSKFDDPWWLKAVVVFLFIFNTTQAATVIYMSWFYCVTNFANPSIIAHILWPYSFTALGTAILALMNQIFQSWRIYAFTRKKILSGGLALVALVTFVTGITAAVQCWVLAELAKLIAIRPVVEANLALQCVIDVAIAAILSVAFSRSKTDLRRTDKVLNRLSRHAVQSGSFTAIFALGTLFSFRFSPETYMSGLFGLPIGRIYTQTMMDHLIGREQLRSMLSDDENIISFANFRAEESIIMRPTSSIVTASKMPEALPH
ncbi:hypothetical protein B0H15DRAFT_800733 [Mycena belliarum]|uniref:DUF6534 domain-containing protein n=1 Tax=Mycena belliarum TaxID=1033014 RepID=A0AAD6U5Q2_9AGAR|nr:hypothetical protein B0H15DRAFT_800733 [Mycena belliae]